jgi:DNA polymerase-3 subunit delta
MSSIQNFYKEIEIVKQGKISPAVFLYGGDFFLQDLYLMTMTDSVFSNSSQVSGKNTYYCSEITSEELSQILFTYSLFQETQVTILKDIGKLVQSARKVLMRWLEHPGGGNFVILTSNNIEPRNNFYKKIQDKCKTIFTDSPGEKDIPEWINTRCDELNRGITPEAVEELFQHVGSSLLDLNNAITQLNLFLETGKDITKTDVDKMVGVSRVESISSLQAAVGEKDTHRAYSILLNLLDHHVKGTYIITMLTHLFWNLLYLKESPSPDYYSLRRDLRIYNQQSFQLYQKWAQTYSKGELDKNLKHILETDLRIKTTNVDERLIITHLLSKVLGE